MRDGYGIAVGALVGNWLLVPFALGYSFTQSFGIGVGAGCLILAIYGVKAKFKYK